MATPFIAGCTVAAGAYAARSMIRAWHTLKTRPRSFYQGGFQSSMTRREAALILGVRERTPSKDVKDAYKKVMKANHPDQGGSHYLSNKINEAKNVMLGAQNSSSAF
ncbi:Mitochondrial import inner membrane translocase subunit TIM14-1 [Linum grandiflorum]